MLKPKVWEIVLVLQVSFRYHCQLYSEWRRTNQKVRLLIPDTKGAHSTQHSLLSTKLLKKTADETIVWGMWCRGAGPDRGGISVLQVLDTASSTRAAEFWMHFFLFNPFYLNMWALHLFYCFHKSLLMFFWAFIRVLFLFIWGLNSQAETPYCSVCIVFETIGNLTYVYRWFLWAQRRGIMTQVHTAAEA